METVSHQCSESARVREENNVLGVQSSSVSQVKVRPSNSFLARIWNPYLNGEKYLVLYAQAHAQVRIVVVVKIFSER
jgi:tetrahydromethanopterin S-methyltransferase subunit E